MTARKRKRDDNLVLLEDDWDGLEFLADVKEFEARATRKLERFVRIVCDWRKQRNPDSLLHGELQCNTSTFVYKHFFNIESSMLKESRAGRVLKKLTPILETESLPIEDKFFIYREPWETYLLDVFCDGLRSTKDSLLAQLQLHDACSQTEEEYAAFVPDVALDEQVRKALCHFLDVVSDDPFVEHLEKFVDQQ